MGSEGEDSLCLDGVIEGERNERGVGRPARPISGPIRAPFDLAASRTIYSPWPRATHQLIRHSPPRSREERDTIPERRGSS
jgi:hypothetical protein